MSESEAQETGAARLILASASPRRRSLLQEAGFTFTVEVSDVNEEAAPPMLPIDLAMYLAVAKADAVAARFPDHVVLAADTVVAFGDQCLGKPADEEHARRMLQLLSGTTHVVVTGVAITCVGLGKQFVSRVLSAVKMRSLSDAQIARYVAGGEWRGKAGGYGIQDGDEFVIGVSGCYTNVVGLPMKTTARLLSESGVLPMRV